MLGRLVNKFEQQTLNEDRAPGEDPADDPSDPVIVEYHHDSLPMFPRHPLDDSGTESENEEELEQLQTTYLLSIAAREAEEFAAMGPSPPALTSSPPLLSDFDTNSWDSTGSSAIILQENEEDPTDVVRENGLQDTPVPFASTPVVVRNAGMENGLGPVVAAGGFTISGNTPFEPVGTANGAFRPVPRRFVNDEHEEAPSDPAPASSQVGEKRRYDNITPRPVIVPRVAELSTTASPPTPEPGAPGSFPGITTGGINGGIPRETLIACRRTPVKLLVYNPDGLVRSEPIAAPVRGNSSGGLMIESQGESPPFRPIKRGRTDSYVERPFLDFEKMREQMMPAQNWNESQDSDLENDSRKPGSEEEDRTDTPDGPRCARHETAGCQECRFRPYDYDDDQPGPSASYFRSF